MKDKLILKDYFSYEDKESILAQMQAHSKEWGAIPFLLSLLKDGSFHQKLGKGSLYLLLDEEKLTDGKPSLASFLTFCDRDEIESNLKPWIGFVFTAPAYRGHHLAGQIIEHCMNNAAALYPESEYVYVSSDEKGLYEKYGFEFVGKMKNVWGEDSGIFRRKIEKEANKITYKTLTPEDYDELWSLWNQVEQTKRALNPVDDTREGITRYMKRNPATCFAATSGGKIIGAILTGHDGRRAIIHHLCVHPDFQRMGIARTLVAKAEEALKKEGITKAFGLVFKDNDKANSFWEKMGYSLRTNLNYRNKSLNADVPTGE